MVSSACRITLGPIFSVQENHSTPLFSRYSVENSAGVQKGVHFKLGSISTRVNSAATGVGRTMARIYQSNIPEAPLIPHVALYYIPHFLLLSVMLKHSARTMVGAQQVVLVGTVVALASSRAGVGGGSKGKIWGVEAFVPPLVASRVGLRRSAIAGSSSRYLPGIELPQAATKTMAARRCSQRGEFAMSVVQVIHTYVYMYILLVSVVLLGKPRLSPVAHLAQTLSDRSMSWENFDGHGAPVREECQHRYF